MRSAAQRHLSFARGHAAEAKALAVLLFKGYRPLARRFSAAAGEIDLIVTRGRTIAFVEVKARPRMELAFDAIGSRKRERFTRAARLWLAHNPWAMSRTLRADAVLVAPRRWPKHLEGVFELEIG